MKDCNLTSDSVNLISLMKNEYNFRSSKLIEGSKEFTDQLTDSLISFVANLPAEENLYKSLRIFAKERISDDILLGEFLDTVSYCESDNADAESTLIKLKIVLDNNLTESLQIQENKENKRKGGKTGMIVKTKKESVMAPSTRPYGADQCCNRETLDPVRCFVILDKNDKPMLSRGGVIITNAPRAEEQIQSRADELYRLIPNAKSIYMIEDEDYDECVNIHNTGEYVEFVKNRGKLIDDTNEKKSTLKTTDLDDSDFLIDVEMGDLNDGYKD